MPTLDTDYFLMPPLQQCIFDKTLGTFLSAGIVNFFSDPQLTIKKNVYRLSIGSGTTFDYINVGSTLTLSSIGSFVDENGDNFTPYLFPFDAQGNIQLYYIQVLDSNGSPQFTINAYPNIGVSNEGETNIVLTQNMVSNPQFIEVNFITPSITYTVSGTNTLTNIAPNWYLNTTGSGSVTVTQVAISDPSATSNPPYALNFSSWGGTISSAFLQQDFQGDPRLLGRNIVSASIVATSLVGVPLSFSISYSVTGQAPQLIATGNASPTAYTAIVDTAEIVSTGTNTAPNGKASLLISLPVGQSFNITSVQLIGVGSVNTKPNFLQQSTNIQESLLFGYWQPQLNFKPIPSYLTGWDFALNPAQIFPAGGPGPQALGDNTSYYAWDQTIVFQSKSNSINIGGSTLGLIATTNTQFAVIQYLSLQQAFDIFLQASISGLSSNIRCSTTVAQNLTISLWWTANGSLPNINSNQSLVLALDANGHPSSVVGGWHEILRTNKQTCTFTTTPGGTIDYGFNGWMDLTAFSTGTFFAIVVGSNQVTTGNNVDFKSISLVPGSIPTIPAPQKQDQVIRECQYYYERSYDLTTVNGAATNVGSLFLAQSSFWTTNTAYHYPTPFCIDFKVIKAKTPAMTLYSVTGASGNVQSNLMYTQTTFQLNPVDVAVASFWGETKSLQNANYTPATSVEVQSHATTISQFANSAGIRFHYVADARLGTP